jgi:hypothetical protein
MSAVESDVCCVCGTDQRVCDSSLTDDPICTDCAFALMERVEEAIQAAFAPT